MSQEEHNDSAEKRNDTALSPAAMAHYLSWARKFIERYYPERFQKDIDSGKVIPLMRSKLVEYTKGLMEIAEIQDPDRQRMALGIFGFKNDATLRDVIGSSYMFARAAEEIEKRRDNEGSDQPDVTDPEQKELSAANMAKLARGLKASLIGIMAATGNLPVNPALENDYYRTTGVNVVPRKEGRFRICNQHALLIRPLLPPFFKDKTVESVKYMTSQHLSEIMSAAFAVFWEERNAARAQLGLLPMSYNYTTERYSGGGDTPGRAG